MNSLHVVLAITTVGILAALPWLIDFCLWFAAGWVNKWVELVGWGSDDGIDITSLDSRAGARPEPPDDEQFIDWARRMAGLFDEFADQVESGEWTCQQCDGEGEVVIDDHLTEIGFSDMEGTGVAMPQTTAARLKLSGGALLERKEPS